ncbi:unnamed protein product [Withania somnifera]
MDKVFNAPMAHLLGALLSLAAIFLQGVEGTIGVNYGTVAGDLPPPVQVVRFLRESTFIRRVRLFDANPEILKAFARTGISVTVHVPNDLIPQLTELSCTTMEYLLATEVISAANKLLIGNLVPAMETLQVALVDKFLDRHIQISTPHFLGILSNSTPPSTGKFRPGYGIHVLKPLLEFLRAINSPFMINPYPVFDSSDDAPDYALFRPNPGVFDEITGLTYTNMLDAQLDAVFSALKLLDFEDIDIVIAEIGMAIERRSWASRRHLKTSIFALFDKDLKPGPTCERNFRLFKPDMTPLYDIGILRPTVPNAAASTDHSHTNSRTILIILLLVWLMCL